MTRLLIVDDSALMRRLMVELFADEPDFETATARDGEEALAQLSTFRPDVVTLDVHMPKLDGLATLDRLMLEHPCPVVMVSSLTAEGAEETLQALELGAVDFISKPGGAMSMKMDALGPLIVAKVRQAAGAKVRRAHRLAERLRLRAGTTKAPVQVKAARKSVHKPFSGQDGDGLVIVGCSTGGPQALDVFLGGLPADFPWPIIIAQHMPASFTGLLARRLDKLCALPVVEAAAPILIEPGVVYVGRGDADALVSRRPSGLTVLPAPSSDSYRWHPSVDRLVDSAMSVVAPNRLMGVLMTGMGDDGAKAMTRLKAAGGWTLAEAEDTAVIWGMPGELIKAGGASVVAPLDGLAVELVEAVRQAA